jgi:ubiquinone/menaquinone biosynthesis C-methylase UbiE
MGETRKTFIPAAGHDWFLPLYDPLTKLLGGEAARKVLLEQADVRPGQRLLDIGCGTGSLAVLSKRLHPDVEVVGLDPDAKALALARRKAQRASVRIQFDEAFADALPYADASVDRVLSSFMLHHLQPEEKAGMLREVGRVLKANGSFHLVDFDGPRPDEDKFLARLIHSSHHLSENAVESILALMGQAGLAGPSLVSRDTMLFGCVRLNYFQAAVQASEAELWHQGRQSAQRRLKRERYDPL